MIRILARGRRLLESPIGTRGGGTRRGGVGPRPRPGQAGIGWWSAGRRRSPTSLESGNASQAFPAGRVMARRGTPLGPLAPPGAPSPRYEGRKKGYGEAQGNNEGRRSFGQKAVDGRHWME